jgi:hypothetical protein
MVAVDHQEVDLFAAQDLFEACSSICGVRVVLDEVQLLLRPAVLLDTEMSPDA